MVKLTQTIRWQQPTNCLSVFDHSLGLVAFNGLTIRQLLKLTAAVSYTFTFRLSAHY